VAAGSAAAAAALRVRGHLAEAAAAHPRPDPHARAARRDGPKLGLDLVVIVLQCWADAVEEGRARGGIRERHDQLLLITGEKAEVEALFSISALIDGWSLLCGA